LIVPFTGCGTAETEAPFGTGVCTLNPGDAAASGGRTGAVGMAVAGAGVGVGVVTGVELGAADGSALALGSALGSPPEVLAGLLLLHPPAATAIVRRVAASDFDLDPRPSINLMRSPSPAVQSVRCDPNARQAGRGAQRPRVTRSAGA
jgi:hypothetical protein